VKAVTIIVGLIFLVGGILLWVKVWPEDVLTVIKGGVVVSLILIGLGALMIGISEIRSAAEEKRMAAELAASTPPQEPPSGQTPSQS
jgi:ABC-type multidrug transport system permease subunit